jgi:hypothetical protein
MADFPRDLAMLEGDGAKIVFDGNTLYELRDGSTWTVQQAEADDQRASHDPAWALNQIVADKLVAVSVSGSEIVGAVETAVGAAGTAGGVAPAWRIGLRMTVEQNWVRRAVVRYETVDGEASVSVSTEFTRRDSPVSIELPDSSVVVPLEDYLGPSE